MIAEVNVSGDTVREYLWLPEAEIAPAMGSRTQVDWPVAVVDDVETGTPVIYHVHADHLARPVRMTDATKTTVWQATWLPWGGLHAVSGALVFDARFPGQWYQLEAGLHYNWHRHYDPTLGRYTQPDPLGFVDGPSVFAYAKASPQNYVDEDGLFTSLPQSRPPGIAEQCGLRDYCKNILKNAKNFRGRAYAIVIACLAFISGEEGPSPPTLQKNTPQTTEGPPTPGPTPPPKDPPVPPGSTHDTGQSTLP